MEDDELQAIRARRMAELQAQSGKSAVSLQHGLAPWCTYSSRNVYCRVLVLQDRLVWVAVVAMVHKTTKARKSKS